MGSTSLNMLANKHPKVSVVFITYNRPDFLVESINGIKNNCKYPNLELVVSDDCTKPSIEKHLDNLAIDKISKSKTNQGLGANTNKGIRAASGEYILHLQDDFECISTEPFIEKSIQIMQTHSDIGLVRLHHSTMFPNKIDYELSDGTPYSILEFDQPKDMKNNIYIYSDHPHLKKSDFHDKSGYFTEGLKVGETEDDFCKRFNLNRNYKVATLWRTDFFKNNGLLKSTRKPTKRDISRNYLSQSSTGLKILKLYSNLPLKLKRALRRF
tara:strand:+ start:2141 stop:2947 length:807 start_codon:yes stop_codon:yes gene_type:complete